MSTTDDLVYRILAICSPEGYEPEDLEQMRFLVGHSSLKAERDELRECLEDWMNYIGAPPTDSMSYDSVRESLWAKSRAILSKP